MFVPYQVLNILLIDPVTSSVKHLSLRTPDKEFIAPFESI